ncbi:protein kinase domain-containing protein [Nonomuraea fuscirosea]|uniref:protein kinase domain-containing protein n=1 Tax=Nonomuraea fuscirosea TaxID=1291556 RepID=UPI0034449F84
MPTAQPLRTGDPHRLGEYELSGRLGEGGQGAVFLGSRNGETYAVKLLHGPVGDEQAAFLREVELAKHVARFCTAQVIDAGFDYGRPYIVSEYVDGPSLHREVALTGPRRGGALERLAVSTATALTAIHRAGIVHRDFKPQNVLLGSDGPRVIDFGLARALDAAATVSGRGVGTPAYMAPEQITASAVTGAADVFSWGATMCFAANATAPFGQDSVAPVLHRILTAPPELGLLDGRLRTLVAACLDKDARNRPSSRELLFELLGEATGDEVPAEVLRSPPPHILRAPPLVPGQRPPTTSPEDPEERRSPGETPYPLAEPEATGAAGGEYRLAESSPDPWLSPSATEPTPVAGRARGWPRAAVAVCAALLVTAAVLLTIVVPALSRGGDDPIPPGSQAAAPSPPPRSRPATDSSSSGEPAPTRKQETRGPRESAADPPPARPPLIAVPVLTGLDKGAAGQALKKAGLVLGAVTQVDSPQKIGQVLSSKPGPGAMVDKGATVTLRVSKGVAVPSVAGMRRKAAESALTGAGLRTGAVTFSCSREPTGQVLATAPQAGRRLAGGSPVALTLSRHGATVPSVVGQSGEAGRATLAAAGFAVRTREQLVEEESRAGLVLAQSVSPNTCAAVGRRIVLTIGVAGQSGPGPDPGESTPEPAEPVEPTVGE